MGSYLRERDFLSTSVSYFFGLFPRVLMVFLPPKGDDNLQGVGRRNQMGSGFSRL
jgi:hypothetical protein